MAASDEYASVSTHSTTSDGAGILINRGGDDDWPAKTITIVVYARSVATNRSSQLTLVNAAVRPVFDSLERDIKELANETPGYFILSDRTVAEESDSGMTDVDLDLVRRRGQQVRQLVFESVPSETVGGAADTDRPVDVPIGSLDRYPDRAESLHRFLEVERDAVLAHLFKFLHEFIAVSDRVGQVSYEVGAVEYPYHRPGGGERGLFCRPRYGEATRGVRRFRGCE